MSDAMLTIKGERFTCECKCNVFKELESKNGVVLYSCNGCGTMYEGQP